MTDASLQERLRQHAKAFDGLLSLIPAKMYYGEDNSDQWKKKKQTREQAKAAKRGKLDPDSELNRNAKEVMDERARNKRKLQEMQDDEEEEEEEGEEEDISGGADEFDPDFVGLERERPGEGLKKKLVKDDEDEKGDGDGDGDGDEVEPDEQKIPEDASLAGEALSKKQKAKQDRRLAKKLKKEDKKKLKDTDADEDDDAENPQSKEPVKKAIEKPAEGGSTTQGPEPNERIHKSVKPEIEAKDKKKPAVQTNGVPSIDAPAPLPNDAITSPQEDTSASASVPGSPIFDTAAPAAKTASVEPASATTSIASTVGPSERPKYIKLPSDTTALRARLAARIEALRAARKADDPDGKPIRTRQELIEARREKQAQRRAHKKELRQKAQKEEDERREAALASARTSPGSILSPLLDLQNGGDGDEGDSSRGANNNQFAFGRIAFTDGTQMAHDMSYEKGATKKKGPSDPKTALAKLEAQKKRVAGLDPDKRKEVLEKETWLAARRRAEGEKVRDDETLLKKAVKRKEKAKKKSEREWKDRAQGVEAASRDRQRKREENIRKRKEQKLVGKAGKKKGGASKSKKNRPGFEGSFGIGGRKK